MKNREPDWKEMYLKMARATEAAIRLLIETQQECERLCVEREDE